MVWLTKLGAFRSITRGAYDLVGELGIFSVDFVRRSLTFGGRKVGLASAIVIAVSPSTTRGPS